MPIYSVRVQVKSLNRLERDELADYVRDAVRYWGGQQHPDSEFFPSEISVKATTLHEEAKCDDFDTFLQPEAPNLWVRK